MPSALVIAGVTLALMFTGGSAEAQAPSPTTASTTEPAMTLEEARAAEFADMARRYEGLEVRPERSLDELLEARLEEEFLVVKLTDDVEPGRWRQPISEHEDWAGALWVRRPPKDGDDAPNFSFELVIPGQGGVKAQRPELFRVINLITQPPLGSINLSQDVAYLTDEGKTDVINVNLVQLSMTYSEVEPQVRLMVSGVEPRVEIATQTFAELARKHRAEFDQYVRPMLTDLGIADVLQGDVRAAAVQLLLAELPVDEAMAAQVDKLLADLDSAQYQTREAAQAKLAELGRPAATVLARRVEEAESLSPEQVQRSRSVIAEWQKIVPDEAQKLAQDPAFWESVKLLSGSPEDEQLAKLAEARLAKLQPESRQNSSQSR